MKLRVFLLTAMICTLCVGQASALEYTMDAPEDHLFGRPTSDDTIYEWEDPNVDRSKNTALIPPGFGSPTSYLPGSGTALTPNLVPGALDGGLVSQTGAVNYPLIDGGTSSSVSESTGFTEVTSDLYYGNGSLGTLKIPAIGLTVKVYEGTGSSTLAKGAGHFEDTSLWDGNCCIAGHNRGVRNDFGKLHTLEIGDTITWTTKLGTRTYEVVSVERYWRPTPAAPHPPATTGSPFIPVSKTSGPTAGASPLWPSNAVCRFRSTFHQNSGMVRSVDPHYTGNGGSEYET